MNGPLKSFVPLLAALAVAACSAGGSSNVPGSPSTLQRFRAAGCRNGGHKALHARRATHRFPATRSAWRSSR